MPVAKLSLLNFPGCREEANHHNSSSEAQFHPRSRKIGLEGKMNCTYIAPDRCLSNQFLRTWYRLHQCPRQPVPVLHFPSYQGAFLYSDGSMGEIPYLPVQPQVGGAACCTTIRDLCSVLKTVFPSGQGGDGERNTVIKSGVQIQMAEIHLLPRINNREVREVNTGLSFHSLCKHHRIVS